VDAAFDAGLVTSDAGALLLGATDRAIGMVDRFAAGFRDYRASGLRSARNGKRTAHPADAETPDKPLRIAFDGLDARRGLRDTATETQQRTSPWANSRPAAALFNSRTAEQPALRLASPASGSNTGAFGRAIGYSAFAAPCSILKIRAHVSVTTKLLPITITDGAPAMSDFYNPG
jgi:hypothetical protein